MNAVSSVASPKRGLDKGEVRSAAAGRWVDILSSRGIPRDYLDGRHHPCPKSGCGGTDRFRLIDEAAGAVYCNQCGHCIGDGLASIVWWEECDFPTALAIVAEAVGMTAPTRKADVSAPSVSKEFEPKPWSSALLPYFQSKRPGITEAAFLACDAKKLSRVAFKRFS